MSAHDSNVDIALQLPREPQEHEQPTRPATRIPIGDREEEVGQVVDDLPHLGVEEHEHREQQQQRQGAHEQVGDVADLLEHLPERPAGHRHEAVAGDDEHDEQDEQVADGDVERLGGLEAAERRAA